MPPIAPALLVSGTVVLETCRADLDNRTSLVFTAPLDTIIAHNCAEVRPALEAIDRAVADGCWVAGHMAYEAGYCLEERFSPPSPAPLMWFGVYSEAVGFDHVTGRSTRDIFAGDCPDEAYGIIKSAIELDEASYAGRIARIKAYIAAGDVYQVNFTTRYGFGFEGSPYALYTALKKKQSVPYAAFMRAGADTTVLSLSPELFLRRDGATLTVKPMKGTARRGRTIDEDARCADELMRDPKNRAENVMIVDLMRNDLGRICSEVTTERLFDVEVYESLLQMTSTVRGTLDDGSKWSDILSCLFPSGSVTGAPKIRAMELIRELEAAPRGIYTGAIGYIAPYGLKGAFNVPIRTIVIENGRGVMGIGSGIVADSEAASEYAECRLKAAFFEAAPTEFALIESMLWAGGGYQRLGPHMERLVRSAEYFGFKVPDVARALEVAERELDITRRYKVRLLLHRDGRCEVAHGELAEAEPERLTVALSPRRTSSDDVCLFHKTTNRGLYDAEYKRFSVEGHADVLFLNEKGQLTEGAISNVYIEKGGVLYTAPVECGLLGGVMRRVLLDEGGCVERIITEADLRAADAVYISNSVRGLRKAVLV